VVLAVLADPDMGTVHIGFLAGPGREEIHTVLLADIGE